MPFMASLARNFCTEQGFCAAALQVQGYRIASSMTGMWNQILIGFIKVLRTLSDHPLDIMRASVYNAEKYTPT